MRVEKGRIEGSVSREGVRREKRRVERSASREEERVEKECE